MIKRTLYLLHEKEVQPIDRQRIRTLVLPNKILKFMADDKL